MNFRNRLPLCRLALFRGRRFSSFLLIGGLVFSLWGLAASYGENNGDEKEPYPALPVPKVHALEPLIYLDPVLPVGERLEFRIRWSVFHVADTVMEIHPMKVINNRPVYHFSMETRTRGIAERLYRLRDEIQSFVRDDFKGTALYRKNQKGRSEREIQVVFDWDRKVAQRTDWGNAWEPVVPLEGPVFDPLSVTFAFRRESFTVGDEFEILATDGHDVVVVDTVVHRREVVTTPMGRFECFVVEPDTKHLRGVFAKSDDSNIIIWFHTEPPHVPVKLRSAVAVGSFEAVLQNIHGPGRDDFLRSRLN